MLIFYGDVLNTAGLYSTRSVSDISTTGSASGSYPVANIVDPNPAKVWKRTGCTSGSTVGVRINVNTVDNYASAAAGLILMNVRAYNASGKNQPFTTAGTVTVGTSAGGTQVSTAKYFNLPVSPDASIAANALCLFIPLDTSARVTLGGDPMPTTSGNWYIDVVLGGAGASGGNPLDIQIGRVMLCPVWEVKASALNISETLLDQSEIVQSYSGVPFPLRRVKRKRVVYSMVGLRDRQVVGYWSNAGYSNYPSVCGVNRSSGKTDYVGVQLVEPSLWSNTTQVELAQPFATIGLLDNEITATLDSYTPTADGGVWNAELSLTEVVV